MSGSQVPDGITVALLHELSEQLLPRALDIRERVERGERLDEFEIRFLQEVFDHATAQQSIWDDEPELQAILARMIHIYHEITAQALANERASRQTD